SFREQGSRLLCWETSTVRGLVTRSRTARRSNGLSTVGVEAQEMPGEMVPSGIRCSVAFPSRRPPASVGPLRGQTMKRFAFLFVPALLAAAVSVLTGQDRKARPLNVEPPPIAKEPAVRYDYDIVYVRAPRHGDDQQIAWTEVFSPLRAEPGSDLMLLH